MCADARVSVCVCEKRERVWVYVCVVVWACVDLAFGPSSILYHSCRNYCCIAPSLKTWQLHACSCAMIRVAYDTPRNFPPCSPLCSGCPFWIHHSSGISCLMIVEIRETRSCDKASKLSLVYMYRTCTCM